MRNRRRINRIMILLLICLLFVACDNQTAGKTGESLNESETVLTEESVEMPSDESDNGASGKTETEETLEVSLTL